MLPVNAPLRSQRFVLLAAERTSRLIEDAKTDELDPVASFEYVGAMDRGDRCMIDVGMVAVPSTDTASVANPLELLFEQDSALFESSKIMRQKSDWPRERFA